MKRIVLFSIPVVALIALLWYYAATTEVSSTAESAAEVETGEAVAVVNGEEISEAQFAAAVRGLGQYQQAAVNTEPGRRAVADQLIQQRVLAQEGRRRDLHRSPGVAGRIAMAEDQILAEAALTALGEDDSQTLSDEQLVEILATDLETAKISQIVLDGSDESTLRKAEQIVSELEGGAKFSELVEEHSIAPAEAGDIGEVTRNVLLPNVADAIFSTPAGGYTEPVQIGPAYHIFWVRERISPDPAEVMNQIRANPRGAKVQAAIKRLRAEANVELNDEWMRSPGQ